MNSIEPKRKFLSEISELRCFVLIKSNLISENHDKSVASAPVRRSPDLSGRSRIPLKGANGS